MSIGSQAELEALQAAGRVVRRALDAMASRVVPGTTTRELDDVASSIMTQSGARSAPKLVYSFPGATCISVNEEIVHGVPGDRTICPGDVVKIDVTVEKDGFIADAARTILVPPIDPEHRRLRDAARTAFERAMDHARAGNLVSDIGRAVEDEVLAKGFSVIRELTGHGVGRTVHENPVIPNYYDPRYRQKLTSGLVVAIEPIITTGDGQVVQGSDGWTVSTADGAPAAHHEHTLVITDSRPLLLTAA